MPPGREVVVIAGIAAMTMLRFLVAFPKLLAALTVKLYVPATDGVPVIAPVDWCKYRLVGRLPPAIAQFIGAVPVAAIV